MKVTGIEQVKAEIDLALKKTRAAKTAVLNKIVHNLKAATPVDTGHASEGWKLSNGNIINNVEYIDSLNAGSSQQAPAHFVERVILGTPGVTPVGTIVTYR